MKIYHGSKKEIQKPNFKGSDPFNDYGPSFYMTFSLDGAKSWACKNNEIGVVNEYELNKSKFESLKTLNLTNKDEYSVLNWIAILMHFRKLDSSFVKKNRLVLDWLYKYYIDVDNYDVVIGYRADDSYFRFPISFISNDLAIEDLEEVFKSGNLGIQYAFMSEEALSCLSFKRIIECDESYLGHYYSLVSKATKEFDEILNKERDPNKHYVLDLMRNDNE